jgi:thioredoxin-like negative regulator of GroEL
VAFVAAEGVDSETMQQVMRQLAGDCPGSVQLRTIDAQANHGWKQTYQLETLPTILLLHRGREIRRWRGARDRHLLRTALNEALGRFEPSGPVAITVPILPGPQDDPGPATLAAETTDSVEIED